MKIDIDNDRQMRSLGEQVGRSCTGGEIIELIGDVGAGKTTFAKGLGLGLDIEEDIQSPSFTVSRLYDARNDLHFAHYDFYRLQNAGVMAHELEEAIADPSTIVAIEWSTIVEGVLPKERLQIRITPSTETRRTVEMQSHGDHYKNILEDLK